MKAESSQIPVNKVNEVRQPNVGRKPTDALWSYVRRLTDQVKSLELAATTARRDINRIDRKQYRELEKSPPSEITGNGEKEQSTALFGY